MYVLINLSQDAEAGDTEALQAPVMSALFGEALVQPRALRRVLFSCDTDVCLHPGCSAASYG